jgi:hypothetical protein
VRRQGKDHATDAVARSQACDLGGGVNPKSRQRHAVKDGIVVEKRDGADGFVAAQCCGELQAGFPCAIEDDRLARSAQPQQRPVDVQHSHPPADRGEEEDHGEQDKRQIGYRHTGKSRQATRGNQGNRRQRRAAQDSVGFVGVKFYAVQPQTGRTDDDQTGQRRGDRQQQPERNGVQRGGDDRGCEHRRQIERQQHNTLVPPADRTCPGPESAADA